MNRIQKLAARFAGNKGAAQHKISPTLTHDMEAIDRMADTMLKSPHANVVPHLQNLQRLFTHYKETVFNSPIKPTKASSAALDFALQAVHDHAAALNRHIAASENLAPAHSDIALSRILPHNPGLLDGAGVDAVIQRTQELMHPPSKFASMLNVASNNPI